MKRSRMIIGAVALGVVVLLGLCPTLILAGPDSTDHNFNYTITATGTEDVTTYPDQGFSWQVYVRGTERYIAYWECCDWDWMGNCIGSCPVYRSATVYYYRTGSGLVNATEGQKLITSLYLPPPSPQRGGTVSNVTRTVSDSNTRVTTTLSGTGGYGYRLYAITTYSETVSQPWSDTEMGSASVSVADGDKHITTSTLVAPNGDTAWSVSDDCACVSTLMDGAELYAAVADTTPPTISVSSVSPAILWPPNHKLVQVKGTLTVEDNCDPAPTVVITVESNEPINAPGVGDGNTEPDWLIDEDYNLWLRAERDGIGIDRIYTITVTATDASGNSASAQATVTVPHDQSGKNK